MIHYGCTTSSDVCLHTDTKVRQLVGGALYLKDKHSGLSVKTICQKNCMSRKCAQKIWVDCKPPWELAHHRFDRLTFTGSICIRNGWTKFHLFSSPSTEEISVWGVSPRFWSYTMCSDIQSSDKLVSEAGDICDLSSLFSRSSALKKNTLQIRPQKEDI